VTATPEQLADEARRARKVRHLVDITTTIIMQSNMTRFDAERLVEAVRWKILELFPGSEDTYEVVYRTRFTRLIDEFTSMSGVPSRGVVIPFSGRPH
jgi:hypothetical protein